MQASHPGDSSLARAAALLDARSLRRRRPHRWPARRRDALAGTAVLVIAHPSDPKWEATVNGGSPLLDPAEIDAIEAFVRDGGGLIVLGETEEDKYGANLNELLGRFDLAIDNATVQDYEHHHGDAPSWVLAALDGRRPQRRRRPARRGRGSLLLPRRRPARRQRRPRDRPRAPSRLDPGRPAGGGRRARRRPRRRHRRLRPLRRRLHRRARPRAALAQPRPLGRPARLRRRARADALARHRRPGLDPAARPRSRSCASPRRADGSVDTVGARPGQAPQPDRGDRRVRRRR